MNINVTELQHGLQAALIFVSMMIALISIPGSATFTTILERMRLFSSHKMPILLQRNPTASSKNLSCILCLNVVRSAVVADLNVCGILDGKLVLTCLSRCEEEIGSCIFFFSTQRFYLDTITC